MRAFHRESKKSFDCSKCPFKTHKYADFRTHISDHLLVFVFVAPIIVAFNSRPIVYIYLFLCVLSREKNNNHVKLHVNLFPQDLTEEVDGKIDLPDDWMEKPSIVSTAKSPIYPGYGPKRRPAGVGNGEAGSFDFEKNVAGFVAKRRRGEKAAPADDVTMTPVVFKEETGEYFGGYLEESEDVKPDIHSRREKDDQWHADEQWNGGDDDDENRTSVSPAADLKPRVAQPSDSQRPILKSTLSSSHSESDSPIRDVKHDVKPFISPS